MDGDIEAQFLGITGSTPEKAEQYLRLTDFNLEQAIQLFFDSGGVDLEGQDRSPAPRRQNHPAPRPQQPRPSQGYADVDGVIHVDSDEEMEDEDDEPEITGWQQRTQPASGSSTTAGLRTSANATPPLVHGGSGRQSLEESDEAMARRLQEELYAGGDMTGNFDNDGVRAPIARVRETLVGGPEWGPSDPTMGEAIMAQLRGRTPQGTSSRAPGIFNQRPVSTSIWEEGADPSSRRAVLSRTTGGASETSSKASLLAEMFRPPFELMCHLPWDGARTKGREEEKWILVNVQDPAVFDCQVLNRDIWKDPRIMETVKENFIFMQYNKDDPHGREYMQYYFQARDNQEAYPHIAIVDPRTGEQVKVWSGPPVPKAPEFLMQLHEFLDRYSLKANAKNPVAVRKPAQKKAVDVARMTEDEMLEMALQASMAGSNGASANPRDDDPDALTRSTGYLDKGKGKARQTEPLAEEDDLMDMEAPETNGNQPAATSNSRFARISSTNPHVEPPLNPAATRIQFRHSGGRVIRRFAVSDPVSRIYEWLKAEPLEGKVGVEFELVCMGKNLIDSIDLSIEQAGLKNQTVMVEFIED